MNIYDAKDSELEKAVGDKGKRQKEFYKIRRDNPTLSLKQVAEKAGTNARNFSVLLSYVHKKVQTLRTRKDESPLVVESNQSNVPKTDDAISAFGNLLNRLALFEEKLAKGHATMAKAEKQLAKGHELKAKAEAQIVKGHAMRKRAEEEMAKEHKNKAEVMRKISELIKKVNIGDIFHSLKSSGVSFQIATTEEAKSSGTNGTKKEKPAQEEKGED